MKTRKTRLATVTRKIQGARCEEELSPPWGLDPRFPFGLKIRYDLEKEKLLKERVKKY